MNQLEILSAIVKAIESPQKGSARLEALAPLKVFLLTLDESEVTEEKESK